MRGRITGALACVAVLGSVGVAHASAPGAARAAKINTDAAITIEAGGGALQLDPHKQRVSSEFAVLTMLYDRLLTLDQDGELQPQLATKWSFSSDGRQLTVTVRDGAVFHDRSPVTPDAVKQSIQRAQTVPGSTASATLTPITAVDVVGANQVRFSLNRPALDVLYVLATNAAAIVNPKAFAQNLDLASTDHGVAGSGPWVAAQWNPPVGARFERASTEYWDKKAGRIKTINLQFATDPNTVLNAVRSGQADGAVFGIGPTTLDAARTVQGHTVYEVATQSSYNLQFRDTRPGPVSNLKFRQAVAYGIDRKTISEQLLDNTCKVAYQPFPPGTLGSHSESFKNPYPYNPKKAKKLLAESGVGANPAFDVMLGAALEPQTAITTAIVAQLKEIGITANVVTIAVNATTAAFRDGRYDSQLQLMGAQAHPSLWYTRFILPGGTLFQLASGPAGQAFATLVNSANDPGLKDAALQAKWDEITTTYLDNVWTIPICYETRYWMFPNDVKNAKQMPWVRQGGGWDPRYLYRTAKS